MINPRQYPLCESFVDRLNHKFHEGGWVTLCDERIFSCLVSDTIVEECMTGDSWEMRHCETGPLINEHTDGAFISYFRHEKQEIEPIVLYLENEGRWPEQVFLSEEFVMFFRLHKKSEGSEIYVYYQVDECGDDVEVARIDHLNVTVRLKYIKEYIAIKNLNLLIFDDELVYNEKSLDEFGFSPIQIVLIKDNDCVFSYALNDAAGFGMGYKTSAVFRGKCVYRHNDNDIKHLWKLREKEYENFIVGTDDDGNEYMMSCEESKMPNLFNRKADEPYSLSPIFFKREVLNKYFQAVEKYLVQDGYIAGPTWGIRIDNDRSDGYVVTALVDLGRMPHKEQKHWKSFNVLPPKGGFYSETTVKRWFGAIPTDSSEAQDLVFRKLYIELNNNWNKKYGWALFKTLAEDDQYHFDSLHLMGNDNDQKEFDGLIQSITKVVIDSLDETQLVKTIDASKPEVIQFLREKDIEDCNPSKIKGGIAKFECFLISEGMLDEEFISLLRKIQELRSGTVAHRKSTKLDSRTRALFDYFDIQHDSDKNVWSKLLTRINGMLDWLISTTV